MLAGQLAAHALARRRRPAGRRSRCPGGRSRCARRSRPRAAEPVSGSEPARDALTPIAAVDRSSELAGLDLADERRADGVEGAALGGDDPAADSSRPRHERADARAGRARRYRRSPRQQDQAERAAQARHGRRGCARASRRRLALAQAGARSAPSRSVRGRHDAARRARSARSAVALTRLPLWAERQLAEVAARPPAAGRSRHGSSRWSSSGCGRWRGGPAGVPSARLVEHLATRPISVWTLQVCSPSAVAMPALSWPRCWRAYSPK